MVLSGDPAEARARLRENAPGARIEEIEKAALEPRRARETVAAMRAARYDAVALFSLSIRWQRRRAVLLLLAVIGGARRVLLFSADGGREWFTRARILAREVPRTLLEAGLLPLLILVDWLLASALLLVVRARPPRPRGQARAGRPTRWLYLRQTPASGALESGASSHFRGLLEGVDELGQEVHVLSNDELPSIRPSPRRTVRITAPDVWFNTSVLGSERWGNLVWLWRAWREIGQTRPDAVYHRNARSAWASVVAAWLRGVPAVLEYNTPEALAGAHWNNLRALSSVRRAERLSLTGATRVGAVSEELAEMAVLSGAPPERVFVNPNGVDVERFGTPESQAAAEHLRAELGLDGRVVAGFVGTFLPYHGTDVLVEAIERLASEPRCHFLLIGDGAARAGAERRLAEHVRGGRVTFTGRIRFESLPDYLAAVDICLAPYVPIPPGSPFINSPVKLFEYMAAGRAIVASRLGQIARVLADEESGLLVPPGDAHALARAVARLVEDGALRRRLGRAARAEAVAHYTWRANAARVADALASVTGGE